MRRIGIIVGMLCSLFVHTALACTSPNGMEGQIYYNSTGKKLYVCDGTSWQDLAKQQAAATDPATCGAGTEGNQYYNNTDKKYYYCNGTTWTELGGGSTTIQEVVAPKASLVYWYNNDNTCHPFDPCAYNYYYSWLVDTAGSTGQGQVITPSTATCPNGKSVIGGKCYYTNPGTVADASSLTPSAYASIGGGTNNGTSFSCTTAPARRTYGQILAVALCY